MLIDCRSLPEACASFMSFSLTTGFGTVLLAAEARNVQPGGDTSCTSTRRCRSYVIFSAVSFAPDRRQVSRRPARAAPNSTDSVDMPGGPRRAMTSLRLALRLSTDAGNDSSIHSRDQFCPPVLGALRHAAVT